MDRMLRLEDVPYDDPRVIGAKVNLLFPQEAREQAPYGPGVCVVVGSGETLYAVAAENLSGLMARIIRRNLEGELVVRHPGLPASGTLHFFATAGPGEAEGLSRDLLRQWAASGRPVTGDPS